LQEVENKGGIVEAFKQNFIQDEIKRNFEIKKDELLNNEKIMVGVNKFKENQEGNFAVTETPESSLDFDLLKDLRLSTVFENRK
jgi:methylmalonyl-CoA mutase N-terminal domain/subunit